MRVEYCSKIGFEIGDIEIQFADGLIEPKDFSPNIIISGVILIKSDSLDFEKLHQDLFDNINSYLDYIYGEKYMKTVDQFKQVKNNIKHVIVDYLNGKIYEGEIERVK